MDNISEQTLKIRRRKIATLLLAWVTLVSLTFVVTESTSPSDAHAATCRAKQPASAFQDQVASSPRDARIWRLYQTYFLRQPDRSGFNYWISTSAKGTSLQSISNYFSQSTEFRKRYGSLNNDKFLALIYRNVLCRPQDKEGFAYWKGLLDSGELTRGELMVLFSESEEYMRRTNTTWSLYSNPDNATLKKDGYQIENITGGQIVKVDYARVDFKASANRCSVASINGNWFFNPETQNPTPIGYGVIDGRHVSGSQNRDDRGIIGERYRPNGPDKERVWTYQGNFKLNSNLASKNGRVLESWRSWQPSSTPRLDDASQWRWAAAGIPLIVNGQIWEGFAAIPTNDYTHYTTRHSFVAFDKHKDILVFGTTTARTSAQLIAWAQASGYEDLVKFDGGGSAELNVNGQRRVAGTSRDVPIWLGIGC